MKRLLLALALIMPSITFSQLTVTLKNDEDFTIGTVLKFMECDSASVSPGSGGMNQTWDFSSLKGLHDTSTEWMISPSSTPNGKQFPGANQVEKYSNGDYVYVNKTSKENSLLGYVATKSNMVINYPKPVVFAIRPCKYGVTTTNSFTDNCTSAYYSFNGGGKTTIEPDGYGTLILPNGTYHNVLRIKVTQMQADTVKNYNSVSQTVSVTYAWFDGKNTSALMKISSTHSSMYKKKTVEYLLSEVNGK